jgi:hypothetical protein
LEAALREFLRRYREEPVVPAESIDRKPVIVRGCQDIVGPRAAIVEMPPSRVRAVLNPTDLVYQPGGQRAHLKDRKVL